MQSWANFLNWLLSNFQIYYSVTCFYAWNVDVPGSSLRRRFTRIFHIIRVLKCFLLETWKRYHLLIHLNKASSSNGLESRKMPYGSSVHDKMTKSWHKSNKIHRHFTFKNLHGIWEDHWTQLYPEGWKCKKNQRPKCQLT